MKKNLTSIAIFILFAISIIINIFLFLHQNDPIKNPSPVYNHLNNDVVISKGFNYDNQTQIVLSPYTGNIINPCPETNGLRKYNIKNDDPCDVEIKLITFDNLKEFKFSTIDQLRELTKNRFKVQVSRNGTVFDENAYLLITGSVLFKGSHCETTYSGGSKTSACTTGGWLDFCKTNEKYRHRTDIPVSAKNAINYCEKHYWK